MSKQTLIEPPVQIIEKHGQIAGIRDKSGILLFSRYCDRYPGQPERYERELKQQRDIAAVVVRALTAPDLPDDVAALVEHAKTLGADLTNANQHESYLVVAKLVDMLERQQAEIQHGDGMVEYYRDRYKAAKKRIDELEGELEAAKTPGCGNVKSRGFDDE